MPGTTAPTITGTHARQGTTNQTPLDPFADVTIDDSNLGATDTLTITLSGGGGTLSGVGLTNDGGGVYTLSGAAAAIATDLEALSFTPTAPPQGTTATTDFALSDVSSAYTTLQYNSAPTDIASFAGSNGQYPSGGLISDSPGDLFGTTYAGGTGNDGTVFEIAKTASGYGPITTIASFGGANGKLPEGNLWADSQGDLFGTTSQGGANGYGEVFEIAKTSSGYGPVTSLASFTSSNGAYPSDVVADTAGDLFGTTFDGGTQGYGTVYEVQKTSSGYGGITVRANFGASNPYALDDLIVDTAGDLFGVTLGDFRSPLSGVATSYGSVFEIAKTGSSYSAPVTLATFGGANGAAPVDVIADTAGDLFGVTEGDGVDNEGTVFEIAKTPSGYGPLTVLATYVNSDNTNDFLVGSLVVDSAGDLYGETDAGGAGGAGTVFEIAKTSSGYGPMTTVTTFSEANGEGPASLSFDSSGDLIGTASSGGANGDGVLFEITQSPQPVPTVDTTTSVVDSYPYPPTITGTQANQTATGTATIEPFQHVTITDGNVAPSTR